MDARASSSSPQTPSEPCLKPARRARADKVWGRRESTGRADRNARTGVRDRDARGGRSNSLHGPRCGARRARLAHAASFPGDLSRTGLCACSTVLHPRGHFRSRWWYAIARQAQGRSEFDGVNRTRSASEEPQTTRCTREGAQAVAPGPTAPSREKGQSSHRESESLSVLRSTSGPWPREPGAFKVERLGTFLAGGVCAAPAPQLRMRMSRYVVLSARS